MTLDNMQIREIIPHRYPFLMIDKVLEVEPGVKAIAIKNVTANEPFFQGHFPNNPIMPGVLITEALAQTAGIAVALLPAYSKSLGVFTGIEQMKFRKQVIPGDVLKLEIEVMIIKRNIAKVKVHATVDGKTAAEGVIKFAMVNQPK
jgi:3-hydroxyacyl-[acyl-carrier-protein] dehydratase